MSEDRITQRIIDEELKESYLAYSMSVIIGRALPDVRDGLKPVHRRILFAMKDLAMWHNKAFKKSARIVGEVLGKYHPHGDTAVYDSMVRMAQDFSLRYPLIDGQGNFGSIDGDNAAAMRYTEARLKRLSEELLEDLDKETVTMVENFDGSLKEPAYLPSKLPNLLINGSSGIAVGMATNIPPHNLSEISKAVIHLIDNPECEFEDLMQIVKGPDFPTGGIILGRAGMRRAYATGKGKVVTKSRTTIEEVNNRKKIIVNEIPYMVNKTNLLEQIASHVRHQVIEGISDLRDESDRDGMRIVIELKQNANEELVLNQLFKHTRLQESFGITMLSIVNGAPRVLPLKDMLYYFLEHRKDIVTKRTQYDLKIAKAREHILAGLIIALDHIDEVIQKIKASATSQAAQEMLQSDYSLSELQAKAILDMKLQKLSGLEQQKLRSETQELRVQIEGFQAILNDPQKVLDIIKLELETAIDSYGDDRNTDVIEGDFDEIDDESLIKDETVVVTFSHKGYSKRVPLETYRAQGRGGKGIIAATTRDEDFIEELFIAQTKDFLLIFTDKGKIYWKKVYAIPEASRQAKGTPIINLLGMEKDEKVQTVIPLREFEEGKYLLLGTKNGYVKRTDLKNFSKPRNGGIRALTLDEGDELVSVLLTDNTQQIMLATQSGRAAKIRETDISIVGRTARGVRGIKTKPGDQVIGLIIANDEDLILTITQKGYGKKSPVSDYRLIGRGGLGVINIKTTEKNGNVAAVRRIVGKEDILIITKAGIIIRTNSDSISTIGRNTQGVRVMKMSGDDQVMSVAKSDQEDPEEQAQSITTNEDKDTNSQIVPAQTREIVEEPEKDLVEEPEKDLVEVEDEVNQINDETKEES